MFGLLISCSAFSICFVQKGWIDWTRKRSELCRGYVFLLQPTLDYLLYLLIVGCRGEQEQLLRAVQPQHFLPVHGEYTFLCSHAGLAQELGIRNTHVIRNGQMVGVYERRNKDHVSSGSMQLLGRADLFKFYNDGGKGTGTATEMALEERTVLANEGIVIVSVDVVRATTKEELERAMEVRGEGVGRTDGGPAEGTRAFFETFFSV